MSAGLDRLAERARAEAPPPIDAATAARLVEAAVQAAATRAPAPARRRARPRVVAFVALGLVAAAAVLLVLLRPQVAPAPTRLASAPLRFELPSGDRVTATPGARVQVLSAATAERRLVLADGTALFDVAPLGGGARFEVATRHARVEVRGTVFSVTTSPGHTTVRVYEGRVRVTTAGTSASLGAGETWSSEGPAEGSDPLHDAATAAAAARAPHVTELPNVVPLEDAARRPAPALPVTAPPPAAPAPADAGAELLDDDDDEEAAALARTRGSITLGPAAAERARRAARLRAADSTTSRPGAWRLLEADALRALARHDEAANAYDAAARLLPADDAAAAGYLAATLRLERGDDAAGALASLDASAADAHGAPLEERALALRALALARLGRHDEAAAIAARYLTSFPDGGQATAMRALRR